MVKRLVKESKKKVDEDFGARMSKNFKENKKLFWKDVKNKRNCKESMSEAVKLENGREVTEGTEVKERWSEYFDKLLNVDENRDAIVTVLGRAGSKSCRIEDERAIDEKEVRLALKKLKNGKAVGVDDIAAEMLKGGGNAVIEWLLRLFNVCMNSGKVPLDWKSAIIVPIYKGKGEKKECKNFRGISLLSIPGKVYGRILIERVVQRTERLMGEEQCGFRKGRGCVDQIFALRNIMEKSLEVNKELFVAFMDLEKAYDRVDWKALWEVLRTYGVGGSLLKAVQSFYCEGRASVRVNREKGRWFPVKVGLRQGCVMSPGLFNIFIDSVVKEVNARVLEKGTEMVDGQKCKWEVNQLLFADDTALVGDSEEKLQRLVTEFGMVCYNRKLKVNADKSKVMRVSRQNDQRELNIRMNGVNMESVEKYRYLGMDVAANGTLGEEINHRVNEAEKVIGAVRAVWKGRKISKEAKVGMFESIVVPTMLYGSETWALKAEERRRIEVVELKCLRAICGVTRYDRWRNDRVREVCGLRNRSMGERVQQGVLRWYGHLERMDNDRLVNRIYRSKIHGVRGRGRPWKRWMDGVKEALDSRGMSFEQSAVCVRDRVQWRRVVKGG